MQQGGVGGGAGSQSIYGLSTSTAEIAPPAGTTASSDTHLMQQPVEAASPISSRPPAAASLDELMGLAASAGADEDALEGDRGGGGGVGGSGGNRWPRQETLALIKIRTDMDTAFRDATVKGPLWEDVSRKLAELGYRRSAKKCKEKFENVHKYYKRTKEGRAGRQDGKTYKFFEQLEALHHNTHTASTGINVSASQSMAVSATSASASLDVSPVSIGIPMPISSVRVTQPPPPPTSSVQMMSSFNVFPHNLSATIPFPPTSITGSGAPPSTGGANIGISFSSNSSSSSSSQGTEDDYEDEDDDETEGQPASNPSGSSSRKRKNRSGGGSTRRRMMEFFEKLMKQVMQKQEAMQKLFLEVIEKREQDRMIREEAWKRQETGLLSREHELMAQERTISASRDAAIVSFLQKLTGQTIQLHQPAVTVSPFTPPPPPPPTQSVAAIHVSPSIPPPPPPPQSSQQQPPRQSQQHSRSISTDVVMAVPEQQIPPQDVSGGGGSYEPSSSSSRWPKTEVLALIGLRSGLDSRYQEAGPKGPLWEEISAGMTRLGYKRSSKRCKEKWENINKYFKKVKESHKERPEDSKTCPYYHQLDALYRKKVLNSTTTTTGGGSTSTTGEGINIEATRPSDIPVLTPVPQAEHASTDSQNKNVQASDVDFPSSLFEEGNGTAATKEPEGIARELMERQAGLMQQQQQRQQLAVDDYEKMDEAADSENTEAEEEEEEDIEDDEDDELEEERKMDYKIEFQRQNTGGGASNGGGNGAPPFMALVQ